MRKWVSIFMVLAILSIFGLGCAQIDKQTKVKCPKCGAVFTIDEGLTEMKKGY